MKLASGATEIWHLIIWWICFPQTKILGVLFLSQGQAFYFMEHVLVKVTWSKCNCGFPFLKFAIRYWNTFLNKCGYVIHHFHVHFSLYVFLLMIFFPNFKFFILYWSIANNNVVVVSGEQWRDSAIHSPPTPLPSRLAQY